MTFEILNDLVLVWADQRNLLKPENAKSQCLKMFEEAGELASALLKNNTYHIQDAIGDVLVTLIILSKQLNLDMIQCLQLAYNEIKSRQGQTVDGTFIKQS